MHRSLFLVSFLFVGFLEAKSTSYTWEERRLVEERLRLYVPKIQKAFERLSLRSFDQGRERAAFTRAFLKNYGIETEVVKGAERNQGPILCIRNYIRHGVDFYIVPDPSELWTASGPPIFGTKLELVAQYMNRRGLWEDRARENVENFLQKSAENEDLSDIEENYRFAGLSFFEAGYRICRSFFPPNPL